jgi:hypothetical protein
VAKKTLVEEKTETHQPSQRKIQTSTKIFLSSGVKSTKVKGTAHIKYEKSIFVIEI